jgi:hypothetical protein
MKGGKWERKKVSSGLAPPIGLSVPAPLLVLT